MNSEIPLAVFILEKGREAKESTFLEFNTDKDDNMYDKSVMTRMTWYDLCYNHSERSSDQSIVRIITTER